MGSGKPPCWKIIAGEEEADRAKSSYPGELPWGYLEAETSFFKPTTLGNYLWRLSRDILSIKEELSALRRRWPSSEPKQTGTP